MAVVKKVVVKKVRVAAKPGEKREAEPTGEAEETEDEEERDEGSENATDKEKDKKDSQDALSGLSDEVRNLVTLATDSNVQSLAEQYKKKEEELRKRESEIAEKEAQLKSREGKQETIVKTLQEKARALADRDEGLEERAKALDAREKELAKRAKELEAKLKEAGELIEETKAENERLANMKSLDEKIAEREKKLKDAIGKLEKDRLDFIEREKMLDAREKEVNQRARELESKLKEAGELIEETKEESEKLAKLHELEKGLEVRENELKEEALRLGRDRKDLAEKLEAFELESSELAEREKSIAAMFEETRAKQAELKAEDERLRGWEETLREEGELLAKNRISVSDRALEMQARERELDEGLAELKRVDDELQEKKKELEIQAKAIEESVEAERQKVEQYRKSVEEEIASKRQKLEEENAALEKDRQLSASLANVREELAAKAKSIKELEDSVMERDEAIKAKEARLAELEASLGTRKALFDKLDTELAERAEALSKLEREIADKQVEADQILASKEKYEAQRKSADKDFMDRLAELNKKEEELRMLEEAVAKKEAEQEEIMEQLTVWEGRNKAAEERIIKEQARLDEERDTAMKLIEDRRAAVEKAEEESKKKLAEAEKRVKDIEATKIDLELTEQKIKEKGEALEKENERLDAIVTELEKKKSELDAEALRLKSESDKLDARSAELSKKEESLSAKEKEFEAKYLRGASIEAREAELAKYEEKFKARERELDAIEKDISTERLALVSKEKRLNELELELKQKYEEREHALVTTVKAREKIVDEKFEELKRKEEHLYMVEQEISECPMCSVKDGFVTVQKTIDDLKAWGVDVSEADALLKLARVTLKKGDVEKAIALAKDSVDSAKHHEAEFRTREIHYVILLSVKLAEEAKRDGIDVSEVEKLISDSRNALERGEYNESKRKAKDAEAKLWAMRASWKDAKEALGIAGALVLTMKGLGAEIAHAESALDDAKLDFQRGEYVRAAEKARDAELKAKGATVSGDAISSAKRALEEAIRRGFDYSKEMKLLEGSPTKELALELEARAKKEFADCAKAKDDIEGAREIIKFIESLGILLVSPNKKLEDAEKAVASRQYDTALDLTKASVEEAKRLSNNYKLALDSMNTSQAIISDAKDFGMDVTEAEKQLSLARASLASNKYDDARKYSVEAEKHALGLQAKLEEELHTAKKEPKGEKAISGGQSSVQDEMEIERESLGHKEQMEPSKQEGKEVKDRSEARAGEKKDDKIDAKVDVKDGKEPSITEKAEDKAPVINLARRRIEVPVSAQDKDTAVIKVTSTPKSDKCPSCGAKVEKRWEMCPYCNTDLKGVEEKPDDDFGMLDSRSPTGKVARSAVTCFVCMGVIKPGLPVVNCKCGKSYHEVCSRRVEICPNCANSLER